MPQRSGLLSMSLPPSQQHETPPDSKPEEQEERAPQQAAEAAAMASPVSIIPVAPMQWRMLAFLLDMFLVALFAFLLLSKVLLPQYHPVGYSQWMEQSTQQTEQVMAALSEGTTLPPLLPDLNQQSDEMKAMSLYVVEILGLCVLVYFVLCERLMAGGSIGKSMFRLRVISLTTGRAPNIWESFLRSLIKFFTLSIHPLLWISYLVPFGNRLRRAGHDWLARTLVVSDIGGYVPHVTPPRRTAEDDDGY